MEFLKAILGDELYSQFESKINEYNGTESNKDKQVKIGNLGSGEYVSKSDYDTLNETLKGKETELATANTLIADLKKATNGNEDLQAKISGYETDIINLQEQQFRSQYSLRRHGKYPCFRMVFTAKLIHRNKVQTSFGISKIKS